VGELAEFFRLGEYFRNKHFHQTRRTPWQSHWRLVQAQTSLYHSMAMPLPETNTLPDRVRTIYECQPLFPTGQPWQVAVLASCVIALLAFSLLMTLRDSRQLGRPVRMLLAGLRLIALAGILVYVINPVQRTETRITKDSRVAVLIDTSLCMGLCDEPAGSAADRRRIDEVINWLQQTKALQQLQAQHEVSVYRFGA
jgi:hypothetical protein